MRVTPFYGCMIQIKGYLSRHGSKVKVMHIAQMLGGV